MKVAVIGLGYIGLPMVAAFANVGCGVEGIDKDKRRVKELNKGVLPIYEPGLSETIKRNIDSITFSAEYSRIKGCQGVLVTVGTPMINGVPTMDFVYDVMNNIVPFIRGKTVILKSTVKVGTTRMVAGHLLEKYKLKVGRDYHLAFCPERTIEGLALHELYTLPKIVGGMTPASSEACARIVGKLGGRVINVSKPEVAELCKLVDNTYRTLNIDFANELGEIGEELGIDTHEVVNAVNNAYDRTHIFKPGLGAAGPCLIKDPEMLQSSYLRDGLVKKLIDMKDDMNEKIVGTIRMSIPKSKPLIIAYVGMAFKGFPETDDMRDSPMVHIRDKLRNGYPKIVELFYDPIIQSYEGHKVNKALDDKVYKCNCVLLLNNHLRYKNHEIDLDKFKKDTLIIDCWNSLKFKGQNKRTTVYTVGKGYK